ncbi:Murein hydrolase activator NlpD precursor [Phocoenobacter uteri]|uniref:Murein hydrolase activator NlpD n=1 Tax=Phocoenobacter uteri TaxID=146806 RepID=A0A379CAV7_9PAST|nr:LysM peptidoglycan-binding domain-containing protein [Phocoenobacter uteri]MDG6881422.1 hypothetical protein [Phocoenobacter uteri]SUB59450.1 Murein hydrolase activator NlpD precursor [Phocoenobacter uteri]
MKKLHLVFPIMALTLAGCTTYTPAEETVPVVETANAGWQNTVEAVEEPVYQAQQQPVYQETTEVVEQVQEVGTAFNIPRGVDGKPDYSQIMKGSYTGNSYTVQKGDTLFFVSYLAGKDKAEIARLNNLSYPYTLSVGQVLKLK